MRERISILLVDDHAVMREGLAAIIGSQPAFDLVMSADTGRHALVYLASHKVDVVLLDLQLRDEDGFGILAEMLLRHPQLRVIILSSHDGEEAVARATHLGARGYVTKSTSANQLLDAIKIVGANGRFLSPDVAGRLDNRVGGPSLTPRELEILGCLVDGDSNREIALSLALSEKTIKNHVSALMFKMGAHSRTQAANMALSRGLVMRTRQR